MNRFWKIVLGTLLVLILIAALLYGLNFASPAIHKVSEDFAKEKNLPYWLAGLLGPFIYIFQRISEWIKGLGFGGNVSKENESIKAEQARLRKEVDRLADWREDSLKREFTEITRLQKDVAELDRKFKETSAELRTAMDAPPGTFTKGLSGAEAHMELVKELNDLGISTQE